METDLKELGLKTIEDIMQLQKSKIKALLDFQKAINEKAYPKKKISLFNQENEELVNLISSAREKRDSAKVYFVLLSIK